MRFFRIVILVLEFNIYQHAGNSFFGVVLNDRVYIFSDHGGTETQRSKVYEYDVRISVVRECEL